MVSFCIIRLIYLWGMGMGGIIVTNVYDVVIRSTPICMTNNSDISPSVIPINHSLVKYFLRCSDEIFLEKLRFEITVASRLLAWHWSEMTSGNQTKSHTSGGDRWTWKFWQLSFVLVLIWLLAVCWCWSSGGSSRLGVWRWWRWWWWWVPSRSTCAHHHHHQHLAKSAD